MLDAKLDDEGATPSTRKLTIFATAVIRFLILKTASKRLVPVCLFRASSPWFFSPGTPASFHKVKTDSDRYAGMTNSCPVYGLETH